MYTHCVCDCQATLSTESTHYTRVSGCPLIIHSQHILPCYVNYDGRDERRKGVSESEGERDGGKE